MHNSSLLLILSMAIYTFLDLHAIEPETNKEYMKAAKSSKNTGLK